LSALSAAARWDLAPGLAAHEGSAMEEDKKRITGFLLRLTRLERIQEDEKIFSSGLVNSLLAMQLVMFVEKEFAIQVIDEDLKLENFNTIRAIAELVHRKRESAS
jgi:methoxymalonate biosynthesis acyl carrier protein